MLANRVKETTATTGTGSFTTAGAVAGFQTFNTAFGTDRRFTYWAVNDTDNEWETGIGYLSASTTLVRETVLDNHSDGTTAINFTTAPTLFCAANEGSSIPSFGVLPANRVLASLHQDSITTTIAVTADRVYYIPFLCGVEQSIDGLGIQIKTSAAGNFRVGLYENDKGEPGNLITQTGDLTDTTNTYVTGSITSLKLTPGWYWIAAVFAAATQIKMSTTQGTNILGENDAGSVGDHWGYQMDSGSAGSIVLPSTPNARGNFRGNAPSPGVVIA